MCIRDRYNTAPPDLTVEKLVGYGRTPYHSFGSAGAGKEDEEKVRSAMEITHTLKYKDKCVSDLSGGQKMCIRDRYPEKVSIPVPTGETYNGKDGFLLFVIVDAMKVFNPGSAVPGAAEVLVKRCV